MHSHIHICECTCSYTYTCAYTVGINRTLHADCVRACQVFGDIHGQFYDMLNLIDEAGRSLRRMVMAMVGDGDGDGE